jgi:hypothetical protein
MNRQPNRQMDRQTNGRTDRRTVEKTGEQSNRHTNRQTYWQADKWMTGQTGQIERRKDRQTDRIRYDKKRSNLVLFKFQEYQMIPARNSLKARASTCLCQLWEKSFSVCPLKNQLTFHTESQSWLEFYRWSLKINENFKFILYLLKLVLQWLVERITEAKILKRQLWYSLRVF